MCERRPSRAVGLQSAAASRPLSTSCFTARSTDHPRYVSDTLFLTACTGRQAAIIPKLRSQLVAQERPVGCVSAGDNVLSLSVLTVFLFN